MTALSPIIVVLRFADRIRVELCMARSPQQAIGEFAGRCLTIIDGPALPLLEAIALPVPHDRLRELTEALPVAPQEPPPLLPVRGMIHAIQRYLKNTPNGDEHEDRRAVARDELGVFLARYGIIADFTGEAP